MNQVEPTFQARHRSELRHNELSRVKLDLLVSTLSLLFKGDISCAITHLVCQAFLHSILSPS